MISQEAPGDLNASGLDLQSGSRLITAIGAVLFPNLIDLLDSLATTVYV